MQLYTSDTHMFAIFVKNLLLLLLPWVQETRCEIRRSRSYSDKTKHFDVARENFFNVGRTELFNVARAEFFNVAKSEVFNVAKSEVFNIA